MSSSALIRGSSEYRQSAGSYAELGSNEIVSSQYYDARHPSVCSDGEHRLMLAVLKTAISDYLQEGQARSRSAEAGAWINSKSQASGVFAYDEVCESLGISPDRLRQGLRSLKSRSIVPRLRLQPVLPTNRPSRATR